MRPSRPSLIPSFLCSLTRRLRYTCNGNPTPAGAPPIPTPTPTPTPTAAMTSGGSAPPLPAKTADGQARYRAQWSSRCLTHSSNKLLDQPRIYQTPSLLSSSRTMQKCASSTSASGLRARTRAKKSRGMRARLATHSAFVLARRAGPATRAKRSRRTCSASVHVARAATSEARVWWMWAERSRRFAS